MSDLDIRHLPINAHPTEVFAKRLRLVGHCSFQALMQRKVRKRDLNRSVTNTQQSAAWGRWRFYAYPVNQADTVPKDLERRPQSDAPESASHRFVLRFLSCFYWASLVFHGIVVAVVSFLVIVVLLMLTRVAFVQPALPAIWAFVIYALPIFLGIAAAYRNHKRLQRRELKTRNA